MKFPPPPKKNNRKARAPYFPTKGKPSPVVLADGKIYGGISMEIYETSGNNSPASQLYIYDLYIRGQEKVKLLGLVSQRRRVEANATVCH